MKYYIYSSTCRFSSDDVVDANHSSMEVDKKILNNMMSKNTRLTL